MSLTLITNPVGSAASKIFAGFRPIEFVFKREDIAITSVTAGTGGAKITHAGDLSSYLSVGDVIYFYSEGTGYTYDLEATIIDIVATEMTVDAPFIVTGTGGYMNYFKNYYVELQCVHPTLSGLDLLGFNLQADGDTAGNIVIDVSVMNDFNRGRTGITQGKIIQSSQEFEVQYRQVYTGSAESFTLVDDKSVIPVYATQEPETEVIMNNFDLPKIYFGYPIALCVAHNEGLAASNLEMFYDEQDVNGNVVASGTLGQLDSSLNGLFLWQWPAASSVQDSTKYINFRFDEVTLFDFKAVDFAHPDFIVQ